MARARWYGPALRRAVDEEGLSPAFGEQAAHRASQMPQEGIEGALETNAELPARTVAVRHQVDGIEATIGQQHHPGSLGEGLPDGAGQFAAVCVADHAAAMRQGLPSQGNRAAVEDGEILVCPSQRRVVSGARESLGSGRLRRASVMMGAEARWASTRSLPGKRRKRRCLLRACRALSTAWGTQAVRENPHAVDQPSEHVGEALGVTLVAPLIEAGHLRQGPVESVSLKHGVASSFRGLRFALPEVTPCS